MKLITKFLLGAVFIALSIFIGKVTSAVAQQVVPTDTIADLLYDNFDSGKWLSSWKGSASTVLVDGRGGKILQTTVTTNSGYLNWANNAHADEGYLTFWFNPNNVSIPEQDSTGKNISWLPSKSIVIAEVNGDNGALVALYLQKPITSTTYKVYLRWNMIIDGKSKQQFELDNKGVFKVYDLANDWQKITVGYKVNQWVSLWINDQRIQAVSSITHASQYRSGINVGKILTNNPAIETTPAGKILYDEVHFAVPKISDLWVDVNGGNNNNDGFSPLTAFATIQYAADVARPGTTIHIRPGIYRESIVPANDGQADAPITYTAESSGVKIFGSINSRDLKWTQLTANTVGLPNGVAPTNLYYTSLDVAPRLIMQPDKNVRLPIAREPDEKIATEWKHTEFWWAANGGSALETCDPSKDGTKCDAATRSRTQLTDTASDQEPNGIEAGNLTTLGNLTDATIFAVDANSGHYVYKRAITAHDLAKGMVTVDKECTFPGQTPDGGLGWGAKYFVEGLPQLLDQPGEWWYDKTTKRLYLWPLAPGDPSATNLEISQKDYGFNLSRRSYITLNGFDLEYFNGYIIYLENGRRNDISPTSKNILLNNLVLHHADRGVNVYEETDNDPSHVVDGLTLTNSEIGYMDTIAITTNYSWGNPIGQDPTLFRHPGVINTVIRNNKLHHLGFRNRGDTANGTSFYYADRIRFEGNHVSHVGSNGVFFAWSLLQANDPQKKYGFTADEIKIGEILVKDNIFEQACEAGIDCGGLKFWGADEKSHVHVFRDVLIIGNIMRNTYGWTYISEKRGKWSGGSVKGLGGFGLYGDMASGLHVYRNIAYNNAFLNYHFNALWQDGSVILYNNLAANSLHGVRLDPMEFDTHGSVDTQIANNIFINNERYGVHLVKIKDITMGNLLIDNNLYYGNGWNVSWFGANNLGDFGLFVHDKTGTSGTLFNYRTIADLRAGTGRPTDTADWEKNGLDGDPNFVQYDVNNHNLYNDGSPDFHLTALSTNAIDRGRVLPASLQELLNRFNIKDVRLGAGYDIGPYEFGNNADSILTYLPLILKH